MQNRYPQVKSPEKNGQTGKGDGCHDDKLLLRRHTAEERPRPEQEGHHRQGKHVHHVGTEGVPAGEVGLIAEGGSHVGYQLGEGGGEGYEYGSNPKPAPTHEFGQGVAIFGQEDPAKDDHDCAASEEKQCLCQIAAHLLPGNLANPTPLQDTRRSPS